MLNTFIRGSNNQNIRHSSIERHAQSLLRLSRRLEQARTYGDVLDVARDEIQLEVGYQNVWVYVVNGDGESKARLLAMVGEKTDAAKMQYHTFDLRSDPFVASLWDGRKVDVVPDARRDPRTNKEIVAQLENRTIVHVPITLHNKQTGLLGAGTFGKEGVRPPSPDQLEYLQALASHLAITLDRVQLLEKLQRMIVAVQKANNQLEAKVRDRTTELARSNAELEIFAYVASHDLQEPLRMVSSYLALLERRYQDKLDAEAREFITYAVDGAQRMKILINDLLAYSRVNTRGAALFATDCAAILQDVLFDLKVEIQESGAVISYDTLPTITVDEAQARQLFQNLISNAIKFRGEERPHVHISATRISELAPTSDVYISSEADAWLFSVRDNGIGIDTKYAERIFTIFQRLHTRDEYPGTGIGLAICKRIVERHGGCLWVESQPGEGATFYFTLQIDNRPTKD